MASEVLSKEPWISSGPWPFHGSIHCPDSLHVRELDEAFELPDAGGVPHFAEGLGLNLADPLAGDLELATHFLESAAVAVLEAEALLKDLAFTLGESVENFVDLVLEHGEPCLLHWVLGGLVFDEVTETRVIAVTDWRL